MAVYSSNGAVTSLVDITAKNVVMKGIDQDAVRKKIEAMMRLYAEPQHSTPEDDWEDI